MSSVLRRLSSYMRAKLNTKQDYTATNEYNTNSYIHQSTDKILTVKVDYMATNEY